MSADAGRVNDTDSTVSESDSVYSDSNLPSADEEDDMTYKELSLLMDSWGEAEVNLFFFVKKWVEADEEDRRQHLDDLLERIKFWMMTLTELSQIQSSKLYSESSGAWRALVDKTIASIMSADAARVHDIKSQVSDTDSLYSESNLPSADEDDDPELFTYNELCSLIDGWVEAEVDLFLLVKKWVEADEEKRQHLDDLMGHIRFCLMTPGELKQIQSTKMYIGGSSTCHLLVDKAVAYHKLPINMKILQDSEQSTVRGKPAPTCFMNIIDWDSRVIFPRFYTLDDDLHWSTAKTKAPFLCESIKDCVVVNNFVITTGPDHSEWGQDFHVFDPRTLEYSLLSSCGKCLDECTLVHHQGCLYLIGGSPLFWKRSGNGTVLKYEFQTNKWTRFVNLPSLDSYKVACVFQDCIYVSDGQNVECLDLSTKTWESKAPLSTHNENLLMCVMKVQGQIRLCIVSESFEHNFDLEYYEESTNKWLWLTCSFSQKLDYPMGFADCRIAAGNTVFFYDDHCMGRWDNHGVCLLLNYPEEGNDVAVKTLEEHFYPYPASGDGNLAAHGVMLTVPAHKVDIPEYTIPEEDDWYDSEDSDDDSNGTASNDACDE